MNTQAALHGLRVLSLTMIAGLVVCAPAHDMAAETLARSATNDVIDRM